TVDTFLPEGPRPTGTEGPRTGPIRSYTLVPMILLRLALGLALAVPVRADNEPSPPDAPPTSSVARSCPADMVAVGSFCMDRYEAPNIVGIKPMLMQNAKDAEQWCAKKKKYLCTEGQWVRACKGVRGWKYPYGNKWEAGRCNDSKVWKIPDWNLLG